MKLRNFKELLDELIEEPKDGETYFYEMNYDISVLLTDYRIKNRLSQKELSKLLGVSQAMVSKYENGDYNFSLKAICKLCEKLGAKPGLNFTDK